MSVQNPFFPVLRNPLFTEFDGEEIPVERDALLNGDNGKVLGTVGNVYKLVENAEVDRIFGEAFADLPIECTVDHMNFKENRWQRDFILNGDDFNIVIGDDVVQTKISIWNGYDGKSSVGFSVSAYRRHNNLTMLGKMFGKTYSHVSEDLIGRIRRDFSEELRKFQDIKSIFQMWNRQSFGRDSFEAFIRGQIRTEERGNNGYLSERQAITIIDTYEMHLRNCGVSSTRWGAYNVLSAIAAHDIRGRGNSSNIFAHGYKRMERLSKDFFELDDEASLFVMD